MFFVYFLNFILEYIFLKISTLHSSLNLPLTLPVYLFSLPSLFYKSKVQLVHGSIHWILCNLPLAISRKKTDSSLPQHSSAANRSSARGVLLSVLSHLCLMLTGLFKSCACNHHFYCEFTWYSGLIMSRKHFMTFFPNFWLLHFFHLFWDVY